MQVGQIRIFIAVASTSEAVYILPAEYQLRAEAVQEWAAGGEPR